MMQPFQRLSRSIVIALLAVFSLARPAEAKNLDGRFGFGMNYLGFTQATAVSLRYFHSKLDAISFQVGFNTETNLYQFGISDSRMVLMEENMNLFLGLGAAIISSPDAAGVAGWGVSFEALAGGEFFLAGLPNLGLYFHTGIGLKSLRGTSFRSVGGAFANGGIHYYF